VKKCVSTTLILILTLVSCGQGTRVLEQTGTAAAPTRIVKPTPVEPSPSPTPPHDPIIITLNDARTAQTFYLTVGDTFMLKLGDGYTWQVQIDDERIVARVPNISLKAGAPWLYQARAVGQTEVQIAGDPVCLNASPPCAMPSVLFQVKITVR